MEKPSWAPIVLAGALPRRFTDGIAMVLMCLVSLESFLIPTTVAFIQLGAWILLLSVCFTCALASLSDTGRKITEELALFAYGSSSWYIWLRYLMRGLACTLVGISPFLWLEFTAKNYSFPATALLGSVTVAAGGVFYAAPSLRRIRSRDFVEKYKG